MSDIKQIKELKTLIKRLKSDKINSSAHNLKIKIYEEKLKDLERSELQEESVLEIKSIKKIIKKIDIDKLNKKHFKNNPNAIPFCIFCDLKNMIYCSHCANYQINELKKFMPPAPKSNLKIGRKIKCIKPSFDLEKNKTYLCANFGYFTINVYDKKEKPNTAKNYHKNRFQVYIKPWGCSGAFHSII